MCVKTFFKTPIVSAGLGESHRALTQGKALLRVCLRAKPTCLDWMERDSV